MILETVLLWHHHVAALILSHLDLPLPGGGGGPGVYVNVDLVALVGGGDVHVLTSVVTTNNRRSIATRTSHSKCVINAISDKRTISCGANHT